MNQLADPSRRALETYRDALTPGAASAEANRSAIARRVADGELPLELPEDPRPQADPRRAPALAWIGAVVAVAAAAVAVFGAGARELDHRLTAGAHGAAPYEAPGFTSVGGQAVEREAAAGVPTATSERPAQARTVEAPVAPPRKLRTRRPAPSESPVGETPPPDATGAAMEAALIGRARAALRDHNPQAALSLVGDHTRRFPDGQLAEEAEVVRLAALCDLGRSDEARAGARTFVQAHPGSPLAGHARRICADPGDAE